MDPDWEDFTFVETDLLGVDKDLNLKTEYFCTACNILYVAATINIEQQKERFQFRPFAGVSDTIAALQETRYQNTGILEVGQAQVNF